MKDTRSGKRGITQVRQERPQPLQRFKLHIFALRVLHRQPFSHKYPCLRKWEVHLWRSEIDGQTQGGILKDMNSGFFLIPHLGCNNVKGSLSPTTWEWVVSPRHAPLWMSSSVKRGPSDSCVGQSGWPSCGHGPGFFGPRPYDYVVWSGQKA